jgi:hypothetical protein
VHKSAAHKDTNAHLKKFAASLTGHGKRSVTARKGFLERGGVLEISLDNLHLISCIKSCTASQPYEGGMGML